MFGDDQTQATFHNHRESEDDARRSKLLRRLSLLDTPAEAAFDDVVAFAARTFQTGFAAISVIDEGRLWFKSIVGLSVTEIPSDMSFCRVSVLSDSDLIVTDALEDPRFTQNPLVNGFPNIRSYAGVPIRLLGERIGTLCVLDQSPRSFSDRERETLRFLGNQVEHLIDLHARRSVELPPSRRAVEAAAKQIQELADFEEAVRPFNRPAWVYSQDSLHFLQANELARDTYGWTAAEFRSHVVTDILPPEDRGILRAVIANDAASAYTSSRLWRHCTADGNTIHVKITAAPVGIGSDRSTLVVATDVSAQVALSDALDRAAHTDSLTGLANRRQFVRTLTDCLVLADISHAVLFIDLDRFKMVNDTLGHEAGDALLGAAAARVLACSPHADQVARLGGDEFAMVHPVASPGEARALAERVRVRLEHPFIIDGIEHYVSASIGVAVSNPLSTAQTLLAEADAAMYAAKDAGRNGSAMFDMELRQRMADWSDVQRDLHHAIDDDQIELDYQPIVNFRTGAIEYEALARWNHPTRGRLQPGAFIDVAEESGLINRLGAHILEMGTLHAEVLDASVSVNVSVRQFNRTLVQQVATLISRHGLRPGQLVIEVTESAVGDSEHARTVLDGLRDAGARTWIDDFGTGFSSLARLNSLPFDGLKLAREFVNSLDSPHGWGIAIAIVGIARALEIPVIAEGVETERQLSQVRTLGCEMAQGYLLGRPAPFATRADWPSLASWANVGVHPC